MMGEWYDPAEWGYRLQGGNHNEDPKVLTPLETATNNANDYYDWLGNETLNQYNTVKNEQASNPYGQSNPNLLSLLGRQQGAIQRQYANAEDTLRQSLARRGALGTAQETAAMRDLTMDRSRALSGNEADLRANAYNQAQQWQDNYNQQHQSILQGLMGLRGKMADYYSGRSQWEDQKSENEKTRFNNSVNAAVEGGTRIVGSYMGSQGGGSGLPGVKTSGGTQLPTMSMAALPRTTGNSAFSLLSRRG